MAGFGDDDEAELQKGRGVSPNWLTLALSGKSEQF